MCPASWLQMWFMLSGTLDLEATDLCPQKPKSESVYSPGAETRSQADRPAPQVGDRAVAELDATVSSSVATAPASRPHLPAP